MSDPTLTEWTADTVFNLLMSQEDDHLAHEAVADAHNATLAAEREKYVEQREDWIREIQQLKEQLAAEREARQLAEHNMTNWHQAALRDSAKLDAAIEALKEVRGLLVSPSYKMQIIDAALEKVSQQ